MYKCGCLILVWCGDENLTDIMMLALRSPQSLWCIGRLHALLQLCCDICNACIIVLQGITATNLSPVMHLHHLPNALCAHNLFGFPVLRRLCVISDVKLYNCLVNTQTSSDPVRSLDPVNPSACTQNHPNISSISHDLKCFKGTSMHCNDGFIWLLNSTSRAFPRHFLSFRNGFAW